MGNVINLNMCPINAATKDLEKSGVLGCFVITVDCDGIYSYGDCGMSPEQMLASSEHLKRYAMELIAERCDQ